MNPCRREPRPRARRFLALPALLLAAAASGAAAQSQTDVLFHGTLLSYLDSELKDAGYGMGVHASWYADWKHFLEAGASYTTVDYLDGYVLEQVDLSGAYSRTWTRGALRVGAHLVENTDTLTDGGLIAFGGASAYRAGVWSAGTEASLSRYGAYGTGLTVMQLTPAAGFSAGDALTGARLDATVRGYYVHLSREVGLAQLDFHSGEAELSLTRGRITVRATGWLGDQAFAVRNAGFLVFNIAEVHEGGYGAGLRVLFSPKAAVSAGLYVERLRNPSLNAPASSRSLAFSAGFTL